ncbi:MAG: hypothetical protein KGL39_09105 [Patescibacteria group bacterium]|nr:hypothetical protein [Patescibacteria group bacterium]
MTLPQAHAAIALAKAEPAYPRLSIRPDGSSVAHAACLYPMPWTASFGPTDLVTFAADILRSDTLDARTVMQYVNRLQTDGSYDGKVIVDVTLSTCTASAPTNAWGWGRVSCGKNLLHRGPHIGEAKTFSGHPFTAIWRTEDEYAQRYFDTNHCADCRTHVG